MKTITKPSTAQVLQVMHVLAWIAFIGLSIKTGALLFSYGVSWVNPVAARDLYMGTNLYNLRQIDFWYYTQSVSFMVFIAGMKAYAMFLVIRILSKVNLSNPFTWEVAHILETISYVFVGTWLVSVLYSAHSSWLMKRIEGMEGVSASEEFLFLAGIVFILSQIFKRGVELQTENELTV